MQWQWLDFDGEQKNILNILVLTLRTINAYELLTYAEYICNMTQVTL